MAKLKRVTVDIDETVWRRFQIQARIEGVPLGRLTAHILKRYCDSMNTPAPTATEASDD